MQDTLEHHSRRLGASPMPLAFGEVAEFRRRSRWAKIALDALVLLVTCGLLFVAFAFVSVWVGRG